jgi:hypothetical protein
MFDYSNLSSPEFNKAIEQFQSQMKKAFDFWVDVTVDTIKMYKTK